MYIADLHIHSRFSRATSRDGDLPHLDWWARCKGIALVGTGDFTHPAWRAELRQQLIPDGDGLYVLRDELRLPQEAPDRRPRFIITGEISCIYKRHGRTRKVHHLILLPSLDAADELSARLEAVGNIRSDGRPILGLDSRDLLELTLDACPDAELVPAHIWTPHFAMFGAFSGFDSIEECFGDLSPYIHAVETGLSSDPPMNWRVSSLDKLTLISNSDAHSPARLGREANLLSADRSYSGLTNAVRTGEGFEGTIEFFPEEGKYHLDGHRSCGVCLTPAETAERNGLCPVCGKKLTIGVEHRVEELADRPAGVRPDSARHFESLAPLPEVIAASTGVSAGSKKVLELYEHMLHTLGAEFSILRDLPAEEIERVAGPCVAEGIRRLRRGQVARRPGFDGEYGTISLLTPAEIEQYSGQMSLFGADMPVKKPRSRRPLKKSAQAAEAVHAPAPGESQPNEAQQNAICACEARVAVMAGPGTGKTHTLVDRIAHLIRVQGARPGEITAVTFTNQAASEMRTRLEKMLGGKRAVSAMTIGTFHAVCLKLLGDVRLISQGDALTIAEDVLRSAGQKTAPRRLLQTVSQIKNGASFDEAELDETLYDAYCARLRALDALDFDDLLIRGRKADAAGRRCFTHLLVDEFQDINDIQYELVRSWHASGQSLFVIGDPDQSIYGFRGASAQCFERLREDFPDTREIRLTENYRSSPAILRAAAAVIGHNPGPPRLLHPHRAPGPDVRLVQADDSFSEGVFIAKEIGRMTGGVDMLEAQTMDLERPVLAFSDIAVLCRTHRQLELIEKCLCHDDIPCVISGREDFWSETDVRGFLAFFRSLQVPSDEAALKTALRLLWDCPADLIEKACVQCQKQTVFDAEALRGTLGGYGLLNAWLDQAGQWLPLLKAEKPRVLAERWIEHYGASPSLMKLRDSAVFQSSFAELWQTQVMGQEPDLRRAAGKGWASGAVRLMTLHGSKGLEFPAVFVAGLTSGFLPLESAGHPTDEAEERRLFYVGMTRARDELILTCSAAPSPFTDELPQDVVREKARSRVRAVQQLSLF